MFVPMLIGAGVLGLLAASGKKDDDAKKSKKSSKSKKSKKSSKSKKSKSSSDKRKLRSKDEPKNRKESHPESSKRRKTKKRAKSALVKELRKKDKRKVDWQKAVALALESRDKKAARAVVNQLKKLGKNDEARAFVRAFKKLLESDNDKRKRAVSSHKKKRRKTTTRSKAKPKRKTRRKKKTRRDVEVDIGPAVIEKRKRKKKAKRRPKKASPEKNLAKRMSSMLASSKRYKEDRDLVRDYQEMVGEKVDGLYGRGTAKSLYDEYGMTPPNPYYWPKKGTDAAVYKYRKFLDSIVQKHPARKSTVAELKRTLGR